MRETFHIVMSMYDSYNGTGMQPALCFACLIYLMVQKKEKEKRFLFLGYTLLFFIICFFPLTAKAVMRVCTGEEMYWRMFWLLPSAIITAYTAVVILMQADGKIKRYLLLSVMLLVIVMTGTNVYSGAVFERKQNHYNLPQAAMNICDIVEQDAKADGITHKKLIAAHEILSSVRQYDADILQPYGYDVLCGGKPDTEAAAQIYRIMDAEEKNWEALGFYAAMDDCNYLAYPAAEGDIEGLTDCGFDIVGAEEEYYIYRRDDGKERYKGKWLITQYGLGEGQQLMFYTMQDLEGHLIVVDGGWTTDADNVREIITRLGSHVDAWILTHPHPDHIGAFTELYKNLGSIKIDKVYTVDMAEPEVCLETAPWDDTAIYEEFKKLDIPQLTYVYAGDTFEIKGLAVEVLNAYDDNVKKLSEDLLNDGSMMFRVTAKEESMLFCADVGRDMSDYLLKTYGDDLKSDYIQMGHHGNGGLKSDFYKMVRAKKAFFDAPDWLMNDKSGRYTTMKNTYLMASNGAKIYSFSTAPNQMILK